MSEPMLCGPDMQTIGKYAHLAHFLVESGDDVLFGQRAFFEELFHQIVFALGDQFDEFLMRQFGGFGVFGRDLGLAATCRRHRAYRGKPSCGSDR